MAEAGLADRREAMVRRAFEALNSGDEAAITALIPDDAEIRSVVGTVEGSGVYRGPKEFLQLLELLRSTWDELTWHLDEVREGGERSLALYRIAGVAKGSGVPLEQRLAQVWSWREGEDVPKLVVIHTDQREALESVGIRD